MEEYIESGWQKEMRQVIEAIEETIQTHLNAGVEPSVIILPSRLIDSILSYVGAEGTMDWSEPKMIFGDEGTSLKVYRSVDIKGNSFHIL